LVAETKKYYKQYLGSLDSDGGWSQLPDMTIQEMYVFLATIIQMDMSGIQ